jgi:hypothetical protein
MFPATGIEDDQTKFHHMLSALPAEMISQFINIVDNMPEIGPVTMETPVIPLSLHAAPATSSPHAAGKKCSPETHEGWLCLLHVLTACGLCTPPSSGVVDVADGGEIPAAPIAAVKTATRGRGVGNGCVNLHHWILPGWVLVCVSYIGPLLIWPPSSCCLACGDTRPP